MRVAVIGAGKMGRACAFDLLRDQHTVEVRLFDVSADALAESEAYLRRYYSPPRTTARHLDARDAFGAVHAASGCAVIVSCVPPDLNLALARAAVAGGHHFVDLGGDTEIVREELALHDAAVLARVTVLPDLGLGPGLTTALAVHGMAMLDEVNDVHIRVGALPQSPCEPMKYLLTSSEVGLLHEYDSDAIALYEGQVVRVPALSEVEEIDLGPPFGRCEAAHAGGRLSTLPYTCAGRVRNMDYKLVRYPGHIGVVSAMRAMGFFRTDLIDTEGMRVAPRSVSARLFREHFVRPSARDLVVVRVTARGRKDGRPAEVVHALLDHFDEAHDMTAMMRTTGFPAAIAAQMLARGGWIAPGARPVEDALPPEPFLAELRARGFDLRWERRFLDEQN